MSEPLRVLPDPGPEPDLPSRPAIDDFGFDVAFTARVEPSVLWMYRNYFRVEAEGVGNVPASGRALLVSNHAGVVPWDGAMIRLAVLEGQARPRHARMLVADWAFAMPFLGMFLQKTGNVMAHPDNATELLEREELVGVFPEGVKGATKRYADRYKVKRFGRGGFIQVALRTGSPIVPVAVVGSEEIHPVLFDVPLLAEVLGLPSFPVTPTWPLLGALGAVPLPSRWAIAFGEPIALDAYGPEDAADPGLVLELSERVRALIQARLHELLARRPGAFG